MSESKGGSAVKVKVDREEAVLRITGRSAVFEKVGGLSGF